MVVSADAGLIVAATIRVRNTRSVIGDVERPLGSARMRAECSWSADSSRALPGAGKLPGC